VSTTTVSVTTRLRTWLLVAGLTALLLGAGALAGGAFLYGFVALAIVMNVVGYWFSDRIALAASRAQPLPEAAAPGLHETVGELAVRAAVPMPRLYLIRSPQPNAFATGRNPDRSAVGSRRDCSSSCRPSRYGRSSRTSSRTFATATSSSPRSRR
jgi:heat shock protein HtpX